MRNTVWLGVLLALVGCGSGSTTPGTMGSGFCHDYNVALCARTFECATAEEKAEPFFVALFGKSPAECTQRWTQLCENPPADSRPSVVCPAGTVVDMAKAQQCLTKVNTVTCAQIDDPSTTAVCEEVCGAAPADGGVTADAPPDATPDARPDDTAAATGPTPEKAAFCRDLFPRLCKRTFECIPAAGRTMSFTDFYGSSEADCIARRTATCDVYGKDCVFNPVNAAACLRELPTVMCQVIDIAGMPGIFPPATCLATCPVSLGM